MNELPALPPEVASEWYIHVGEAIVPDGFQPPPPADSPLFLMIICVLVKKDGSAVIGEHRADSSETFNPETGRRLARENAIAKL